MASLGISDASYAELERKKEEMEEQGDEPQNEELDLTGIDDDEIDSYLLTDKEATSKTSMWMKLNGEFLVELEGN